MSDGARGNAGKILVAVVALGSALGIHLLQPGAARQVESAKRDEVVTVPPPEQLKAMTLGYRHAAADLLWAKLLVEHGLRWQEKRGFPELPRYIDGIIALDPTHPMIYDFVDTLLLFQRTPGTPDDARKARRYLEGGIEARPYDPNLWLHYGQYVAFLAPSFLTDKEEIEQWRKDGSFALLRAVELGASADRSLAASSILSKSGEKKAAILHLKRAYALADDADTRHQIMLKLQRLEADGDSERVVERVEHEWRTHYPFLNRSAALLVGPARSAAACAGRAGASRECPRNWADLTDEDSASAATGRP